VKKTVAPRSRAVGLFSIFQMVFSSFPARIPVSSDNLMTNRKNLVVEEVAFFEKAQTLQKLMVRIGKTLCPKAVRRIAVGNFPAF
jgi:hypothetical protein